MFNMTPVFVSTRIAKQESNAIWSIKALALLSVFFAHMPWSDKDSVMYVIYSFIGIIGVPIFLFLSGYLSVSSHKSLWQQTKFLIIPLLTYASITYIISFVINHRWDTSIDKIIIQYFRWVIGSGSIYYFIPVLLFCRFTSKYIADWILIIVSTISILLSQDYLPHNEIFTRYLNPFNFIVYYSIGRVVRLYSISLMGGAKLLLSAVILVISIIVWKGIPTYFNILCIPFSLSILVILYDFFNKKNSVILISIGKISFVVYLIHIQIAGIINSLMRHIGLEHFKVFIAYAVVCAIVYVASVYLKKNDKWQISKHLGFR